MGLVEAILEGSSLVREQCEKAAEKGLAQGHAHGRVEGRTDEARRLLRIALAARFPGLEAMPELDRIDNLPDLESLFAEHALRAQDRDAVVQAILAAAR
jgi:hypothetical protein